ncbi:MAG: hypothetical protein RI942_2465, partial [Pseudomonadota bacterium]
ALNQEITANWADLSRMLDEVLLLGEPERAEYLVQLNARSPTLAAILARLLEIEKGMPTGFLEQDPAVDMQMAPLAELSEGSEVGGYRLLRPLGRGGMGSVWIAERSDGALKRKVALKLPRLPWVEGLTAQLMSERDILCALEHPNIARLYDAGLDASGQPFIAMEYIEGESIDVFCDNQMLTIHSRVELFLQVLKAVQFAHSRLIIHRDLKPANILVNSRGEARLLDFGIAQLQSQNTVAQASLPFDSTSQVHALTLRYASPEQIRKERLTVAADIYSLGVTLYELLLGETPYDASITDKVKLREEVLAGRRKLPAHASVTESALAARKITHKKLRKFMASDLGAIIEKAMKSDPAKRYASVEAFAVDLQRWLAIKPVLAVRSSPWRSISKFIQRNPWPTAIATCSVSVISALAIVATLNAERARAESVRANTTKDFLLSIFDAANPALHGGREISARELLAFGELELSESTRYDERLKKEVYLSLASLWVSSGSRERAKNVLLKSLKGKKYRDSHVVTLLDLTYLFLEEGDIASAESYIKELESSGDSEFSGDIRFEYLWYVDWIRLMKGDSAEAHRGFDRLLQNKDVATSNERKVRTLYGRSVAARFLGEIALSTEDALAAIKILQENRLYKIKYLNNYIEILNILYLNGESRKVWEISSELELNLPKIIDDDSSIRKKIILYKVMSATKDYLSNSEAERIKIYCNEILATRSPQEKELVLTCERFFERVSGSALVLS